MTWCMHFRSYLYFASHQTRSSTHSRCLCHIYWCCWSASCIFFHSSTGKTLCLPACLLACQTKLMMIQSGQIVAANMLNHPSPIHLVRNVSNESGLQIWFWGCDMLYHAWSMIEENVMPRTVLTIVYILYFAFAPAADCLHFSDSVCATDYLKIVVQVVLWWMHRQPRGEFELWWRWASEWVYNPSRPRRLYLKFVKIYLKRRCDMCFSPKRDLHLSMVHVMAKTKPTRASWVTSDPISGALTINGSPQIHPRKKLKLNCSSSGSKTTTPSKCT